MGFLSVSALSQVKTAANSLNSTSNQVTELQSDLFYDGVKEFPYNTELSIALIKNGVVDFIGIKKLNIKGKLVKGLDLSGKKYQIRSC